MSQEKEVMTSDVRRQEMVQGSKTTDWRNRLKTNSYLRCSNHGCWLRINALQTITLSLFLPSEVNPIWFSRGFLNNFFYIYLTIF